MGNNKKLEKLIEKKVGESFEAGGRTWEIKQREPSQNKPRFYISEKGTGKYGSSLYLLTFDFAVFDLLQDGGKEFYLLDLINLSASSLGRDKETALKRAVDIAKFFTMKFTKLNGKDQQKNSND
jgi:hypothetical protein